MKESLFPELIEAHKTLIRSYEYLQQVVEDNEEWRDHESGRCSLCMTVGRTQERNAPCYSCTYQGILMCVDPSGKARRGYDNPYFEEFSLIEDNAYDPDMGFPIDSVLEAKISLHKNFLTVYELWAEKALTAEETALKLKLVYKDYIDKYK